MEKAKSDSEATGINCSLVNFSDRIMEGCHKLGKQGKFNFIGGDNRTNREERISGTCSGAVVCKGADKKTDQKMQNWIRLLL